MSIDIAQERSLIIIRNISCSREKFADARETFALFMKIDCW